MTHIRFAGVLSAACLGGCATLPPAESFATPAATHAFVLMGDASPTVVLESGLGDGKESWAPVYEGIGQFAQVLAYDRAGYGVSASVNESRDGSTIVAELRSLLRGLKLAPPFVLVGHSVGGTYIELYARNHPEEVAGVVLVDSRHADFTRRCEAAGKRSCAPPAAIVALMPEAARGELAAADETMDAVMRAGPFPQVPLVVLTSGESPFADARSREVWLQTQESLASLTGKATHRVCKDCGHYIHKDDPELVVAAVRQVVETARAGREEN